MDVSGIAGAGKSHLLKEVERAISVRQSIAILSPTDASVNDLRKTGFQARTFQREWMCQNPNRCYTGWNGSWQVIEGAEKGPVERRIPLRNQENSMANKNSKKEFKEV